MPSVLGIGLDFVEPDRLRGALTRRPRLADRLFTSEELTYARSCGDPALHLAARFCAKEAVAKALCVEGGDWHDVAISGDRPPQVRLAGAAETRAADLGVTVRVSLTHVRGLAGAVAVSEAETTDEVGEMPSGPR